MNEDRRKPKRVLIVMPSWLGDAVMATPALRVIREMLPGSFIGGLMRPGIDQLLNGLPFFDEVHVDRAAGMMGPKRVAGKVRPMRYETAVLLTNSFSTALITRLAGIPERLGYDRDGRGLLLTERMTAPRRREVEPYRKSMTNPNGWAPIAACEYYFALARHFLADYGLEAGTMGPMELVATREEELNADDLLERAEIDVHSSESPGWAMLNPGGNNPAKRWPVDRFAALADYLHKHHGLIVMINGAPAEASLVEAVANCCEAGTPVVRLSKLGGDMGVLKSLIRRSRVMVTNDTGPRHIAAAFGVPVVTLFGPTDCRWTTIPFADEVRLLADPALPDEEVANDHPERCSIDRIGLGDVCAAVNGVLSGAAGQPLRERPAS